LSSLGGFAGSLADKVVSSLKSGMNSVIRKINSGISDIWFLPGHAPSLPTFATGAFLTRPTLGLVAEAGPEVIIPLSDPARAMSLAQQSGLLNLLASQTKAGPQTVINAPITVTSAAQDPETVATKTVARMARLLAAA
jgi:hypothetical protein